MVALSRAWTLIVGVPSNDFGGQEPGEAADISKTAGHHGASFPLAAKVTVKGDGAHPFYKWAALQRPLDTPRWNFHKYLVGRDGLIAAAFASAVEPTDARVIAAIEKEFRPPVENRRAGASSRIQICGF